MKRDALTELENLTLNNQSKGFLREIAKWASFLSILGFIGLGFMVLLGVFSKILFANGGMLGTALPQDQSLPFDISNFMMVIYLIFAAIYFFPVYYLFQFSRKMKIALQTKNDEELANAFEVLKSHYKFIGVFAIIILSLYALLFIVAILGLGVIS